ncbi:unnamed protein product [Albugo candida]|uniref:CCHC-type domain-containing protein n=1 Tax=Albugo candida TaxID=65357 RepID=A0A024G244_9STRA|nr:unnamed protein product [Albugo candida]|eukprot:CCI40883.1 unnamed protein product [Albugo candida]
MQNSLNASYSCLEVAESDVKSFAKLHGYAVSCARSKKSKTGEIRKVWLGCVHGGRYEKSGSGLRKTSTIKTGCTWKAVIQRVNDPEHPNLGYKWNLVVTNGEHHGHDTATDASAYTRNIALNSEQEKMVANMIKAGVSPRVILATLRQNDSGCLAVRKDIQNSKQKERNITLKGRRPIEALLDLQAPAPVGHVFENTIKSILRRHAEMDPHQQKQLQTALVGLIPAEDSEVDKPNKVRTCGRPLSGSQRSTRRDPFFFKDVEASQQPKRKCKNCKQEGHNKRTCLKPRRTSTE